MYAFLIRVVDLVFGWDCVDNKNWTYPRTCEPVPTHKDKSTFKNSPKSGIGTALRQRPWNSDSG